MGRSGGLALWTATVAANGAFVWGVPVRLALRTATYTALVRVVVWVQLQIEMRFSALFSKNLTSKFVLRRVDAIRRVMIQEMSNAPLGGKQSGGTGGGQISNREPRLPKFKRSNRRDYSLRRVGMRLRKIGPRKTPASAVNSRESLARVVVSEEGGFPSFGQCRVARGDPATPRFLMPPKKKKAAKKEAPAPASAAAAPGVAAKATDDSAMRYRAWPSAFRRVGSFPRIPLPRHPTDLHRRPYPSPFPSDRRNQRKKRSLTQTKTKLAELCVPRPAFLHRHPPRATSPSPCRVGVPVGAPSSRRSATPTRPLNPTPPHPEPRLRDKELLLEERARSAEENYRASEYLRKELQVKSEAVKALTARSDGHAAELSAAREEAAARERALAKEAKEREDALSARVGELEEELDAVKDSRERFDAMRRELEEARASRRDEKLRAAEAAAELERNFIAEKSRMGKEYERKLEAMRASNDEAIERKYDSNVASSSSGTAVMAEDLRTRVDASEEMRRGDPVRDGGERRAPTGDGHQTRDGGAIRGARRADSAGRLPSIRRARRRCRRRWRAWRRSSSRRPNSKASRETPSPPPRTTSHPRAPSSPRARRAREAS